jgi:hypothetical protein
MLLLLAFSASLSIGQNENCLKTVTYEVQKSVRYSVLPETNVDNISPIDLAHARPYNTSYTQGYCIDDQGRMISDALYSNPAYNPDVWGTPIYRIISDGDLVELYDEQNNLVHQQRASDVGLVSQTKFDLNLVDDFGWHSPIYILSKEEEVLAEDEGLTVYTFEEGTQLISSADQEILLNTKEQILEERLFEDGTLVRWTVTKLAKIDANRAIPIYQIERMYENLSDGNLMENSVYSLYSDYKINGELISLPVEALERIQSGTDYINDFLSQSATDGIVSGSFRNRDLKPYISMDIFPNPAHYHCKVELPNFPHVSTLTLEVVDLIGNSIYRIEGLASGSSHTIETVDWKPGIYFVKAGTDKIWIQERLIKQ